MSPEALVIGGGPAGSLAALMLSRRGWHVTLVEQHRFPREKVCGECVSATGADVLARAALLRSFQDAGAVRLDHAILHTQEGSFVAERLPRPMWGLSRSTMDSLLLNVAAKSEAMILQPARAEAVTPDGDGQRVRVRVRDLIRNVVETFVADVVLVADGKAAFGSNTPPSPTGDFGIKTHFENVDGPRDAIELFATARTYGGLAPIEEDRWNAAFSVPAEFLREFNGDLESLFFDRLVSGNAALARRLRRARSCGAWLAAPLPRFAVTESWPERVVPIGNAAAALEPIGGEGMGLAMRSAELAAEALVRSNGDWTTAHASRLRAEFRHLWNFRRAACRAAATAMSSRWAEDLLPLAASSPVVIRAAMRMIGK